MNFPTEDTLASPLERAGERIASELDACAAAIVIGAGPAAAAVALGVGRAQARRRRVAVCDAVGELAPIQELVPESAEHGLMDFFLHGVSFSKVALPVDPARNLFVLPSGAPPLDHDAILDGDRWARLIDGFREAGALLLLIVHTEGDTTARIASTVDGVVLVGDVEAPPGARVLAHAQPDEEGAHSRDEELTRATDEERTRMLDEYPDGAAVIDAPEERMDLAPETPGRSTRLLVISVAIGLIVLALIALAIRGTRSGPSTEPAIPPPEVAGVMPEDGVPLEPSESPTYTGTADGADSPGSNAANALAIANPGDSLHAAAHTVAFLDVSTPGAANAGMEQVAGHALPALTYGPTPAAAMAGRYFVVTGATRERASADSLLRSLRARGVLRPGQGHLERFPFALLMQRGVTQDQVSSLMSGYRLKGIPVYTLIQPDGSLNIYAGAFETPDAARSFMTTFRATGEEPRVVYRTGRTP